ncbi:hypothetical protein C8J56DRAFT_897935 [Mycena floridula]|nr:hypothetical protein C8J56DRAFT_897935 [Mycena floridula]
MSTGLFTPWIPRPYLLYGTVCIPSGHKPGLYMSWMFFVSDGLAYATGQFRYFSGPFTKRSAKKYMKTEKEAGQVETLPPSTNIKSRVGVTVTLSHGKPPSPKQKGLETAGNYYQGFG